MLTAFVLPGDEEAATLAVPRFSQVALVSVIAIAASGLFQGWRQVGSIDALTSTTYGRLLTVKVVLFAVMVGLGNLGRRWVQRRYRAQAPALSLGPGAAAATDLEEEEEPPRLGELRRSVAAETVIGGIVLVVAALLVNAPPARSALAQPYSTEIEAGDVLVSVTVDPAKAGTTEVHIFTTDRQGLPFDAVDLTAELRLPERDVGPLEVPLERVAAGHYASYAFDLPLPGEWELTTDVLLTDVDQVSGTATIPVR
jgi:copper transport protein